MAVSIRFLDGERKNEILTFGEDVHLVVLGRDAATCQVAFPADEKKVGRQHCALKRVLGRYRLVLDTEHLVTLGGKPAHDEQEVGPLALLQLGPGGPKIEVEVAEQGGLTRTVFQGSRRPAVGEILQETAREARASHRLGILTLVLLFAAGGVGAWFLLQTEQQVKSLKERQGTVLREVRKKMTGLEEQLSRMEPAMKESLRRAAKSSYLVLVRREDGTEAGMGTAWVVGPGVLATNAHVAETHGKLAAGHTLVCRSCDSPPKDHTVERIEVHPGYAEFARIWEEYAPLRKQLGERFEQLHSVAACDVGLMWVSEPEKLATPLVIASKETLQGLSSPDTVGFAGYPAEGMAVGGVNVRKPEPTVQVGHVTAITDFFLGKEVSGEGRLIQHSLPITGGASGSPMLAASGEVVGVISAANFAFTDKGERLPIAVGVNFAQRADLVRELLEGVAAEAQAPRTRAWEEGIKQFSSGKEVAKQAFGEERKQVLAKLLAQWVQGSALTAQPLEEQTVTLGGPDEMGRHISRLSLKLPAGKPRVMIALPANPVDVDLYVFRGGTEEILGTDEQTDWYPAVPLRPDAPAEVDITVLGPTEGLQVTLYVYVAE